MNKSILLIFFLFTSLLYGAENAFIRGIALLKYGNTIAPGTEIEGIWIDPDLNIRSENKLNRILCSYLQESLSMKEIESIEMEISKYYREYTAPH